MLCSSSALMLAYEVQEDKFDFQLFFLLLTNLRSVGIVRTQVSWHDKIKVIFMFGGHADKEPPHK